MLFHMAGRVNMPIPDDEARADAIALLASLKKEKQSRESIADDLETLVAAYPRAAIAASLASLSARSFSGWPSCALTQRHSIL